MTTPQSKQHFANIAKLIREARQRENFSQYQVSAVLGYKNAQFISNVERGLCSVPLDKIADLCRFLSIAETDIRVALVKDYASRIDNALSACTLKSELSL